MNASKKILLAVVLLASAGAIVAHSDEIADGWEYAEYILQRMVPPEIPDREIFVSDFGTIEDGDDISAAIRVAIESCSAVGGGKVIIPSGTYLTGPIRLLSNVNLHLEEGAVLQFKTDPDAYLPQVYTRWEGVELMNYSPLIYAFDERNIAVTGKGILDGQASADNWWSWKGKAEYGWRQGMPEQGPARKRLFQMAADGVPVAERVFGAGDYLRPSFIETYQCRNVLIEGVTIIRSPMWEIHPVLSTNVIVRGVTVDSHGPNNDGCNPESSKYVLIENCIFNTGDDCIAIKSGRNDDGRRIGIPSENIVIRNCQMKDGHGGVVIGSEVSGGCRNVFVENCLMDSPNLDRAIRIKTNSVRGGLIEKLYVRDVRIGEVAEAILKVNFLYEEGDASVHTPIVRDIHLENVSCAKSRYPLFLVGYERSPIRDIILENCRFLGVEEASVLQYVSNLHYENVEQSRMPPSDEWGQLKENQ